MSTVTRQVHGRIASILHSTELIRWSSVPLAKGTIGVAFSKCYGVSDEVKALVIGKLNTAGPENGRAVNRRGR